MAKKIIADQRWFANVIYVQTETLSFSEFSNICYHPCMWVGNNFSQVCLCVCLSVCLCLSVCVSVYVSVQATTFKPLKLGTLYWVYRYILTISRSSLSIKVIRSRSRSNEKLAYYYQAVTLVCLYFTKTYLKGQGHLKFKINVIQCQGQVKGNQIFVYL